MFLFSVAFLLGDMYLQSFANLPSRQWMWGILLMGLIIFVGLRKHWRYSYLVIALSLGFTWSAWYATSTMSFSVPKNIEGKTIVVTGIIASLPVMDRWQTHFLFKLDHTLIRLAWRDCHKQIKVGDKWKLQVRLKRIHSTQNPGSFDFEAWALQKGLRATGYVVASKENMILAHHWYYFPIDHIRQKLQAKIRAYSPHSTTAPWLMALIIGEREGINQQSWQVLRNTGTNHLMAIAGLHIGIIAGFTNFIFMSLWRRAPTLLLYLPAHLAGACAALIVAISYSALAGFSIPTQRACIMLTLFIWTLLLKRKTNAWHVWSFAMFIVLILNPLSILTESFWLSFGTIALIIYGMSGRLAPQGYWWKWGRVQWVIGIGLIPITLLFFQQCSTISFVANTIAIPWLGFFVLPFCFFSGIFLFIAPAFGSVLLTVADKSLSFLWLFLAWVSQIHFATWQQVIPSHILFISTMVGIVLLLLPIGFPGKGLGLIWLAPILFLKPATPTLGDYWVTLLDVGQGLSVVVQTNKHVLVFDTGPKFSDNFDMGESVVLPYLRTIGVNKIDMLVVSHGDNDHIGGAAALLNQLPVNSVKTSVPHMLPSPVTSICRINDSWTWDKIHFKFLHPAENEINLDNDSSCVLSIDNGIKRILLTGDIEKYAEKELISRASDQLAADILVAPHHGSKTSGIHEFISAVHPHFVLYAIGYRNRYHFPHSSVMKAYAQIKATQLDTANSGAITFKIDQGQVISSPDLYRITHKHYWFD